MYTKTVLDIIDDNYFQDLIAKLQPFYGFNILVLCVMDSVFSIASCYNSTIKTLD